MSSVLPKLYRIRKYREHTARRDLVDAQDAQRAHEDRLRQNADQVATSRGEASVEDPMDLARHHAYALRMEMDRRRETSQLSKRQREVVRRMSDVRHAAMATRTVERLAEMRQEVDTHEARRTEQRQLDELGLLGWSRR